jgi:hypothetical protein
MSLKKAKIWNNSLGKFMGFVDNGENFQKKREAKDDVLATEALVMMAVCLRGTWKLPIAYFVQNKISGSFQAKLIKMAVRSLCERLIRVHSLTFDGCAANLATLKKLASSIDTLEKFSHPCGGADIYVILDACHMIKLARNALRKYSYLYCKYDSSYFVCITNIITFISKCTTRTL